MKYRRNRYRRLIGRYNKRDGHMVKRILVYEEVKIQPYERDGQYGCQLLKQEVTEVAEQKSLSQIFRHYIEHKLRSKNELMLALEWLYIGLEDLVEYGYSINDFVLEQDNEEFKDLDNLFASKIIYAIQNKIYKGGLSRETDFVRYFVNDSGTGSREVPRVHIGISADKLRRATTERPDNRGKASYSANRRPYGRSIR